MQQLISLHAESIGVHAQFIILHASGDCVYGQTRGEASEVLSGLWRHICEETKNQTARGLLANCDIKIHLNV